MKIKLRTAIIGFFILSFAFTSCLKDPEVIEYSSEALLRSFSTNPVKGITYPFTINQIGKKDTALIFNADSFPVNTDLKKMTVKMSSTGYITRITKIEGDKITDTIWAETDSLDFTYPVKFMVYAPNLLTKKIYKVTMNVSKTNPDSLVWNPNPYNVSGTLSQNQKVLFYNDSIFVFKQESNGSMAFSAADKQGGGWKATTVAGTFDYASIVEHKANLFTVDSNKKVYKAQTSNQWIDVNANIQVEKLLTSINGVLSGIAKQGTEEKFCYSTDGITWAYGETVPDVFPIKNLSVANFKASHNATIESALLVGEQQTGLELAKQDTVLIAWSPLNNGKSWISITNPKLSFKLKANPNIIFYNNQLYAFGIAKSGFDRYPYTSIDKGITWKKVTKNVLFPVSFVGSQDGFTCTVGNNDLWFMWDLTNDMWRGRINRYNSLEQ